MESKEIIKHAQRLIAEALRVRSSSISATRGIHAEICDFLRTYAGPKSSFLEFAEKTGGAAMGIVDSLSSILGSFIQYVEAGLLAEVTPERRAQLDVVSDFLEQANSLLENKDVHPAAPAIIIGATLEEFLRTWIEAESISLGNKKPGIDNYGKILREADIITKQDVKDITAWAGIRNHAAHGEWTEVSDKQRIRLMLEGVNLFMRKYGA